MSTVWIKDIVEAFEDAQATADYELNNWDYDYDE